MHAYEAVDLTCSSPSLSLLSLSLFHFLFLTVEDLRSHLAWQQHGIEEGANGLESGAVSRFLS